jgi:hypothetical protein
MLEWFLYVIQTFEHGVNTIPPSMYIVTVPVSPELSMKVGRRRTRIDRYQRRDVGGDASVQREDREELKRKGYSNRLYLAIQKALGIKRTRRSLLTSGGACVQERVVSREREDRW